MRRQRFETLKVKKTSVRFVRPGFADHIDNSASGAAKFGTRSRCYNLKFLYRFQRDVDCRALATELLAEEAIVVIATVKTDVIEGAPLTGEGYLVAVGSLNHAHAGSQRQQIFKLATQNWSRANRSFIDRGA